MDFMINAMNKDFSLSISANELAKLMAGVISIQQFWDNLMEDKYAHSAFCQSLASYYHEDGGSPEVREFTITDAKFDKQTLAGSLKCSFKVYYFFTCSDIKNDKNDYLTWTFKIDNTTNKIALAGEEPWIIDN